jgi:hypothetical protein
MGYIKKIVASKVDKIATQSMKETMTKLARCILTFAAAAAGFGIGQPAEAAVEGTMTETFSATYGTSVSPLMNGTSEELALNDFDPMLGTLMGVTLTLISNDTIESDVINLTGQPVNFTGASATLPVTVTGPNGLTTKATGVAGPFSGTANGRQFTTTVAGISQVTETSRATVTPEDFVLYQGNGTFSVDVLVGNGIYSGSSAAAMAAFFGTGNSSGTVEVTYDYASAFAPEPGTLMAGLGALVFCGVSLVRRAKI